MCRIGIITQCCHNYGSALQTYALQIVLKEMGYRCEHIRYASDQRGFSDKLLAVIKDPSKLLRRVLPNGPRKRAKKFALFITEYIDHSNQSYRTIDELRETNALYDVFVCGSDQIWAPNLFHERYYLSFVDADYRKIAYAPSIGLPAMPDHLKSQVASLINGIQYVSVRERQGADIIRQLTGRDVRVVLDPTLLVKRNRWVDFAATIDVPRQYILCYFLGDNPQHRRIVDFYKSRTGYQLVVLPRNRRDASWSDIAVWDAGPREFVRLVQNASVVFTDSFHGTIFSLNLNKEFYAFKRFKEEDVLCQNSRVINILSQLALLDRLIPDEESECPRAKPISYDDINAKLRGLREESLLFLKKSIEQSLSNSSSE